MAQWPRAMLLSDTHDFLFIHVSKAGGSSITRALQPHARPRPRSPAARILRPFGLPRDHRRYRFRKHATLREAEARIPAEVFGGLFKFGFVRNPWDRLVSEYNAVMQKPGHRRHARVRALGFAGYLREEAPRVVTSQVDMLAGGTGAVGVDFVGRFERFESDLRDAFRRIGVDAEIPHLNRHPHAPYREYYDDETRALVEDTWRADVETFGYTF